MESLQNLLDWILANKELVAILGPPVLYILYAVLGKLGRVGWVLLTILQAAKDGTIDDSEAADIFWRLIAVLYGWWPDESKSILVKYAPSHRQGIITGDEPPDIPEIESPTVTNQAEVTRGDR